MRPPHGFRCSEEGVRQDSAPQGTAAASRQEPTGGAWRFAGDAPIRGGEGLRVGGRRESSGESDVKADLIGELLMEALASLDKVAYVRFASGYRNFREAKDFEEFITGELGAGGPE